MNSSVFCATYGRHKVHQAVDDDMNVGTINVLWFPQLYWIFVSSIILAFAIGNVLSQLVYHRRLNVVGSSQTIPRKAYSRLERPFANITAITRRLGNASLPCLSATGIYFVPPTFGRFSLVAANFVLLMVLSFYGLNPSSQHDFENTAYRAGFLSLGMVPLIFLLAGKNSAVGWLTGSSYERFNYLHRWVARTLLITATLHMAYWFRSWAPYSQMGSQLRTDSTTKLGASAWAVLLYIVFSSLAPVRAWRYEFFVVQHAISMVAFITLLFLHTPTSDHIWLWPAVAFYLFDRVSRVAYTAITNLSLFHPLQKRNGQMSPLWACRATLTPLPNNATRITIPNPPLTWRAGQHALVSLPSLLPLQSHPFTICSIPSDNKLEFLVKARRGGTLRIFSHAVQTRFEPSTDVEAALDKAGAKTIAVGIEGPYGRMRPLRQFDSIVLIAGGTGAAFTVPLLREIVGEWKASSTSADESTPVPAKRRFWHAARGAATRRVRFVWVVRGSDQRTWFADQLAQVLEDVRVLRSVGRDIDVEVAVYMTCRETLTDETTALPGSRGLEMGRRAPKDGEDRSTAERSRSSNAIEQVEYFDHEKAGWAPTTTCSNTHSTSSIGVIADSISAASSTSTNADSGTPQALLHSAIVEHRGRPVWGNVVMPVLAAAQGETAVVACGPRGMNGEVRRCVERLCNRDGGWWGRRGTGPGPDTGFGEMGAWFWGESFGW